MLPIQPPQIPLASGTGASRHPKRLSGSKSEVSPGSKPGPRPFLTVIASVLIVLVTAVIVSSILEEGSGVAPGLRRSTARPSVLKNAGYVMERTTGPKIERY